MSLNFGNLANSLRGLWEELVERRLWPVAVALVLALVALPVLLAKPAGNVPTPAAGPSPGGPSSPLAAFQPAVSTAGRKSSEIRKNLLHFKSKDPFAPKGITAVGSNPAGTATVNTGTSGSSGVASAGGASSGATSGTTSGTTSGSTTSGRSAPTGASGSPSGSSAVTYYTYTADVRFGKTGEGKAMTLTRFRALPTSDNPIVVFMGVRNDGETAVFLVSASATTTGDGVCKPSADQCTFLYMKAGNKQTIEFVGTNGVVVDYELKLRNVKVKKTDGPTKAKSAQARSVQKTRDRLFTHSLRSFERIGF